MKDTLLQKVVAEIPQQAQAQYSLTDQLEQLVGAANKLGLYDAADFLTRHVAATHNR